MHQYGVREVEKLLRLPSSTIRGLVKADRTGSAGTPKGKLALSSVGCVTTSYSWTSG